MVRFLFENGADVTARDNEPIIQAARYGRLDVIRFLAEKGADVTAQDNEAIICAALLGRLDVVQWLAQNGADVTARNNEAIKRARNCKWNNIVNWIQTYTSYKEEQREHALDPEDEDAHCLAWKAPLKRGAKFRMCKKRHVISNEFYDNTGQSACMLCTNELEPYVYTNTGPDPSYDDDYEDDDASADAGEFKIEG